MSIEEIGKFNRKRRLDYEYNFDADIYIYIYLSIYSYLHCRSNPPTSADRVQGP